MSHNWPTPPLAELLTLAEEQITIQPTETYKQITVRLWGKGVVLRGEVIGGEIATTRSNIARSEQFIMSRIDARHGAFGLVPAVLDGAIVTNDFPLFEVNKAKLLPRFLEWVSKTHDFVELCRRASEGTTNRVRLKVDRLLNSPFPLPLVDEQRRIVAHIEALAGRIAEARGLRQQAVAEAETLLRLVYESTFRIQHGWMRKTVEELCDKPQYGYTASATYDPIGPHLLRITDIQDNRVDWNTVPYCLCSEPENYLVKPNDLLVARTGATTGKSYLISECPRTVFASYLIRLRVKQFVSPDFLFKYFQAPQYWSQIEDEKRGTGQPNVNAQKLLSIVVPVPLIEEQNHIIAYLDDLHARIDALKRLQAETAAELDALLPAVLDRALRGELSI